MQQPMRRVVMKGGSQSVETSGLGVPIENRSATTVASLANHTRRENRASPESIGREKGRAPVLTGTRPEKSRTSTARPR